MDWLQKNCHYESEWTESAKRHRNIPTPLVDLLDFNILSLVDF